MASTPRLPVTVVGGYLGSGKTSLINDVLRRATERIAVVVNDFGDINIDAELIGSADGVPSDGILPLANGCICCTLVDGFASTLDAISSWDDRPDRVMIEASGVSDPAQIAAYCHAPGMALDAVVVLADAETIRRRVDDRYVGQTVRHQLTAADVLILNKRDLVPADEFDELIAWMQPQNPGALVVSAMNSVVAHELLFGEADTTPDRGTVSPGQTTDDGATHAEFHTWHIEPTGTWSRADVDALMSALPPSVIRVKGFVHLTDVPDHRMVLQRVASRWTLRRDGSWDSDPRTRLVFISTNPGDADAVAACVESLPAP